MMNILASSFTFLPRIGGAEIAEAELLLALSRKPNIYVKLLVPHVRTSRPIHLEINSSLEIVLVPTYLSTAYMFLKELIQRPEEIDIVHAFYLEPSGFWSALAKVFTKKPFTVTCMGRDVQELLYRIRTRTLKSVMKSRMTIMLVDKIIVASTKYLNKLKRYGVPEEKLVYIPWGVNPALLNYATNPLNARKVLGIPEDSLVILSVGRYDPRKGFEYLIRAFNKVVEYLKSKEVILVLVGPDISSARTLMELAKKLGIMDKIIMAGKVRSRRKLALYYCAADIVVVPSILEYGPLVLLEALLFAKPVIASASCGLVHDLISVYGCKAVIPINPLNISEFSKQLEYILISDTLRRKLGSEGQRLVLKEFTWDKIAEKYVNIWRALRHA